MNFHRFLFILLSFLFFGGSIFAEVVMHGYRDMREASVWASGYDPNQKVSFCYQLKGKEIMRTQNADHNGIVKFSLKGLSANTEYEYKLEGRVADTCIKGKVKTTQDYLTRMPPPDFSVAVLGKIHTNDSEFDTPYRTPGGEFQIFDSIAAKKTDAVIWASGAATLRPADWGSRSGIFARYNFERSQESLKKLLTASYHYGVFGEESYGAPNSDYRLWNKKDSQDAFKTFWSNPSYGTDEVKAMNSFFSISDAEFFIMDSCSKKSLLDYDGERKCFWGKEQRRWLYGLLKNSKAKFKIVITNAPFLNPVDAPQNIASAPAERKEVLEFLSMQKIGGVVFVSANKDFSELTRMVRAGAYELFEITAGPATARPADAKELNYFRVPGSGIGKRTFVVMKFEGPEDDRTLAIETCDADGKTLFTNLIKEKSLYKFD